MDKTEPNINEKNQFQSLDDPQVFELEAFSTHIFAVYDTTDIRGIILDDNHIEKMKILTIEMKIHYNSVNAEPDSINVGKYYAVFDDEWHRVKCINCDSENQIAKVFFIDRGDIDVFPIENLQLLDSKFCVLPPQSVKLSMYELEVFKDCAEIQALIDDLLVEEDIYVRVMNFKKEDINDATTLSVRVFLEKDTEKEMNVNESLLENIFKSVVNPKIFVASDKGTQEAYLSHVSEKAIFVQIKSEGLVCLKTLIANLAKDCLNNKNFKCHPIFAFDLTKIYITKSHQDNNWYRVKIVKIENQLEAQVMFVDVGNTAIVKKRYLFLLEDLSKLLARYSEQALEVKLHKISPIMFDKNMAAHLRQMALCTDTLCMKVISDTEEIPIVQLFKRTENNCLIFINDALILEIPLILTNDSSDPKPCKDVSRPEFLLKAPDIPEDDSYFDVYVTMAAHADDLTVQPRCTAHKLEKLMANLLGVCESFSGPHLTSNCVKIGSVYAAQNDEDDTWYRAYVYKIISKTVFAVYACDYGDYKIVSLDNLQPLQKEFYDLPCQAIKAKLVGIVPEIKENWTVDDSLRFNELIVTKSFVSHIKSREFNKAVLNGIVLSLELIDTSTDEDIYIAEVFNRTNQIENENSVS